MKKKAIDSVQASLMSLLNRPHPSAHLPLDDSLSQINHSGHPSTASPSPYHAITHLLLLLLALMLFAGCTGSPDKKASPKKAPTSKSSGPFYQVKQGDTLSEIGQRVGIRYSRLAQWNHIPEPYRITPGQKLRLTPPSTRYRATQQKRSSKTVRKRQPSHKSVAKQPPSEEKKSSLPKSSKKTAKKSQNKLKLFWQWPLKGTIVRNYTQTGNKGIEIAGRVGSPVRAAASGRVIYSGAGLIGYGNLIIIKHDDRYLTAYANNRRLLASKGDKVNKGEPIAEVGTVAGKTPRLHFELRKYGKPVNPIPYLPK